MKRKNRNKDESQSSSLSSDKVLQESKEPCEICGSVGIEGLIMICFKCRETREHTYCARVFLPSVPPIWLCEACRFSSSILLMSDVPEHLMDSETTVADCSSSDPKNSNNAREENHETVKQRSNDMEEVVDAGISLPVILQGSTRDSSSEISAKVNSVIHPPSQPHTSPIAKEASSVFNDTSQDKKQHQPYQNFPKKPRSFRLMGKHLSQSSLDQSLTKMLH